MTGYRISIRRMCLTVLVFCMITLAAVPVLNTADHTAWAEPGNTTAVKTPAAGVFKKKKGNWYYLVGGQKQKGWITVGNRTYFARKKGREKGILVKGWLKRRGKWYYFREKGRKGRVCSMCAGGTYKVNGIQCIFNADGAFVKCKNAGKKKNFIQKIGEMARENQAKNNILASLVVAQACLETGYGRSVYHNNLFGIRAGSGYRKYDSYEEAIEDYTNFMHRYIPRIFGVRDWRTACYIVGRSGYAEAGGYGNALASVTVSSNLTRFNK